MPDSLDAGHVVAAHDAMRALVRETPVVRLVAGVLVKRESDQVTGSFKIRGALAVVMAARTWHMVTGSSGNHGIALARAAQMRDMRVTVFMSTASARWKQAWVGAEGAEVVLCEGGNEARDQSARAYAGWVGAPFISSHDHPMVIAGQGTVGLEIVRQVPEVTDIYVPVGGGGLLAGVCLATRGTPVRVVGVEPNGADRYRRSLQAGRLVRLDDVRTACDGVRAQAPGPLAFRYARDALDHMVAVPDERTAAALDLLASEGIHAEMTGALALAGLLADDARGARPVAVVSGGNVAPSASGPSRSAVFTANPGK